MCGISGFSHNLSKTNTKEIKISIDKMVAASNHRGPDAKNIYIDENVALGHARLSFVDLSELGNQPIISNDRNKILIFNGEIYNYRDLKARIKNYLLKSKSDTEIFLGNIIEHGLEETLNIVDGPFAFALYEKDKKLVTLGRDKFGEKPLYYSLKNDNLIFASDLDILRSKDSNEAKLSIKGLNSYFELGFIERDMSIFEDFYKVPPSTYIQFSVNSSEPTYQIKKKKFYEIKNTKKSFSPEDVVRQTESFLEQSIINRLDADVEIGCLLSGGVDSSVVASIAAKNYGRSLKTFTIGYEDKRFDESTKAKEISKHLGTEHHELIPSKDEVLEAIKDCPAVFSEPFADSSQIPAYLITKFASKYVKGVLSGDGGDEIFGGYSRYRVGYFGWKFLKKIPNFLLKPFLKSLHHLSLQLSDKQDNSLLGISNLDKKITKLDEVSNLENIDEYYLYLVSNIFKDFYPNILNMNFRDTVHRDSFFKELFYNDDRKSLMLMDLLVYLPDDNLVKMDRVSMYHSLEVRCPMLNAELYEFISNLENSWTLTTLSSKKILREILKKYVPKKIMDGPKKGFSIPIDNYFRGELSDWAHHAMIENIPDIIDRDKAIKIFEEHQKGSDYSSAIWRIISFNKWYERRVQD